MKYTKYGIILGVILAGIVISNVVFPSNAPDWAPGELLVALLIGIYICLVAYRSHGTFKVKIVAGIATALIGFLIAMLAFFLVDNLYFHIVSQQSDKILGFRGSHYSSMRVYINVILLRSLLIGIPASMIFGSICGWIAEQVSRLYLDKKQAGR